MEAGNRCFDHRVPEETNRKIVDHISDINLPYSSIAREYLLSEGFPADRIIKTGSPMYEVLMNKKLEIDSSDILTKLALESGKYFLVSAHREENINLTNFTSLVDSLNTICTEYSFPVIFSTHPRTRKFIDSNKIQFHPLVNLIKPLGFIDYNKLQIESKCVLSDSGTISEESSILKFNALNLRQTHERPEAMEQASVIMVGLNKQRILHQTNSRIRHYLINYILIINNPPLIRSDNYIVVTKKNRK
jgi:UDP-N-acetylglucosamine 2-epimerase (non-hydrolysing)